MAAAKKRRQKRDPVTHRFETTLTRALLEKLVTTHGAGKDFRNVTAVRCRVHPTLLSRWLKQGAGDPDAGLPTELYMRMGKAEGDLRAEWIGEVADTTSLVEETEFTDDGKLASKTVRSRRTNGVQWLLERRFRQFRADTESKADDTEIVALLEPRSEAMSLDMALQIIGQIATQPHRLPEAARRLFTDSGWALPGPEIVTHDTTATTETEH